MIDTQHKVIDSQKKNKQKDLFSILIVVDDFAGEPIKLNASALFIFRLKNTNEVNSVLEENSALVDKKHFV